MSRVPQLCFEPAFKPHKQDLCFYKGADFNFSLLVADYPIDFRGAAFAMEIRPPDSDVRQIKGLLGETVVDTSLIKLHFEKLDCSGECTTDRNVKKLNSLPISEGDFITLEGSGIDNFKVLSVTATDILVEGTATRGVKNSRIFFRYKSWASFTVLPAFTPNVVATEQTAIAGTTLIYVQSLPVKIPAGEKLVFDDGANDTLVVELAEDAPLGGRILNVLPLDTNIAANATAQIDAFAVILTSPVNAGTVSLTIPSITAGIPAGTILHFSSRTDRGWEYLGFATVSDTVPSGSVTIPVNGLPQDLPVGAIAYFGTLPVNALNIGITADDTRGLYLQKYVYDLIAQLEDGEKLAVMVGDISFSGYVSDFI